MAAGDDDEHARLIIDGHFLTIVGATMRVVIDHIYGDVLPAHPGDAGESH